MSAPYAATASNGPSSVNNGVAAPAPSSAHLRRLTTDNMNGPLYRQANSKIVLVRRSKKKNDGPLKQLARWFVENQIGFSFNLLALLFLAHGMPRAREHTSKYFTLSYYNPKTEQYGVGWDDGYLILFCIVLFTGLRAASMEYALAPFAKARGISKRKDITRFSEQAWLLCYCGVFWPTGLYLYCKSSYFLNLREMWTVWPSREVPGPLKGYMLAQLGFWIQQIIVINIEDRRKDHWQMFTHHIITSTLIYTAYRYGFLQVGNLILVLMDIGDVFLSFAKCLKYLGFTVLCDVMFGIFMLSWFVARHVFFPMVCYSVWKHTSEMYPEGCFYHNADGGITGPVPPAGGKRLYLLEPLWNDNAPVCWESTVKWSFLIMLLALQALILMWFILIVRVAIKVIRGTGAEDSRSEDEADGLEDDDEYVYEEAQPLEEEVGVDEINLKSWEKRSGVKRSGTATATGATTATGVSRPSDRKELLGRIGCEKQVD